MTEATPNRMWWIVLNPVGAMGLNGVLIDHEGNRKGVLMGETEAPIVRQLAGAADPTVDVSVAHGWAQVPAEVIALHDAANPDRIPAERRQPQG